ncbi:MAG TPA: DUF4242 domain-containing protein [bacterium]|nr:DUF4242 domain-containing protein [bacterium]
MPRYVIERELPTGITESEIEDAVRRAIAVNATLPAIRWVHSNLTVDRRKFFCEYEAPNPDALREAARLADIPCDRVSEVVEVRASQYKLSGG